MAQTPDAQGGRFGTHVLVNHKFMAKMITGSYPLRGMFQDLAVLTTTTLVGLLVVCC